VSVGEIKRGKSDERPKPGPVPKDAWQATCAKADYDLKAGRLVMSGKTKDGRPRLSRGQGYGEADMIVFVPDDGYYELIGSPIIHGRMDTGPVQTKPKPADKKKRKKEKGSGKRTERGEQGPRLSIVEAGPASR